MFQRNQAGVGSTTKLKEKQRKKVNLKKSMKNSYRNKGEVREFN